MISQKLKDFFKFSWRYKSLKNFKLAKPKLNFIQIFSFCNKNKTMADQGKRTKETTGESIPESSKNQKIGGVFKKNPNPEYIQHRIKIYDSLIKEQKTLLENAPRRPINVTLKDGKVLEGKSFETTPLDIAKKISKKLAENVIVAKVTYSKKDPNPFDAGKIVKIK